MFSSFGQLLDVLAGAIIKQEGRPVDDTNPGDLRAAPWLAAGVQQFKTLNSSGRFWNPPTRAEGIAGIYHVAALHVSERQSLRQFIYIWAPPSENNSAAYLADVLKWTGIQSDVELLTLVTL